MRRLLFLCTLLSLALRSYASPPVSLVPIETQNLAGCPHEMTGTATYALASALTGTSSSAIDLGLFGCFSFTITETGNGAVQIWTGPSSTTYTPSVNGGSLYGIAVPGTYTLTKIGRYVWFTLPASSPGVFAPLEVTPVAQTVSIWYQTPTNWPY